MNILLLIIIITFIFYIINIFLKKKEYFSDDDNDEDLCNESCDDDNKKICGKDNKECLINKNGISNCCDGYSCVLPKGKFGNKVCINNKKIGGCGLKKDMRSYNFKSNGLIDDESSKDSKDCATNGSSDGSSDGVQCLADVDVNINNKNDFCEINIFKKNYWRSIFSFCDDFKHVKDPKLRRKLQLKDICKNKKINLDM
jgi:hypothetical protein